MLVTLGCSESERPDALSGLRDGAPSPSREAPCQEGQQRVCGVTLAQGNGVMSCYRGTQSCENGQFSACADGKFSTEPLPDLTRSGPGSPLPASLSSAQLCTGSGKFGNPCDPSCMYFDEVKEITPTPTPSTYGLLPDWSGAAGTATCSHELCSTGVVLDPACHPCVGRVCAVDDTCCTGPSADTWDDACVSLVFSECSSSSAPVPITFCDYSAFGQDSVEIANVGTAYPPIASGGTVTPKGTARFGSIHAKGTITFTNNSIVMGDVVSEQNVWLEAPATVTGDIWAGGRVDVRNSSLLTGDVTARAAIDLETNALITGNAWAGTFIDVPGGARIQGNANAVQGLTGQLTGRVDGDATVNSPFTIEPNVLVGGVRNTSGTVGVPLSPEVNVPDLSGFERNLSASCALATIPPTIYVGSAGASLPPGIYGDYVVNGSRTLTLTDSGTYIFNSLRFNNGARLVLSGTGPWDLSVCEDFHADASVQIQKSSNSLPPTPDEFLLYSDDTTGDCIYIGDDNVIGGLFIAPKCRIRAYNDAVANAALWGKSVYTNTSFTLNPIPKATCDALNPWGLSVCDGTTPLYANGRTYSLGSRVHFAGNLYECAVGGWCSIGGGYNGGPGYWPGRGANWNAALPGGAWNLIGACPPPPPVPSTSPILTCPVDLTIPASPGPREDCYSGLDCQVNSRCTEVLTDPSCAHSKCAIGSALDASCDPCVERICAQDPGCCTDTGSADWDSACLSLVETVCDATCGSVSTGCSHDACVTGPALVSTCDPHVADLCARPGYAYCCDTTTPGSWDAACVEELYIQETGSPSPAPPAFGSVCDYAVFGQGAAQLNSVSVIGNLAWLSGSLVLQEQYSGSGYAEVSGDVFAWSATSLYRANIGGDLLVGVGPATVDGLVSPPWTDSTIGGAAVLSGATLPAVPPRPSHAPSCSTGAPSLPAASGTLTPGIYGDVTVSGTLTLQGGGDYVFETLTVSGSTILLPADPSETVNIYVCQNVEFNNGAELLSPSGSPVQARIYTPSGVMNLGAWGAPVTIYGVMQANAGTITLSPGGSGVTVHGLVHSYYGTVQGNENAVIDSSGFTRDDCLARGVDVGQSPAACPFVTDLTASVAESGICAENAGSYQVSSSVCSDVDLAVGRSCDDQIILCNHGNTTVPAGEAELVFYPRAAQQFATDTPDPLWQVGTCPTTSALPAGACLAQECSSSLLTQDLTVMAQLTSSASVSECSRLDNWSYFEEGNVCGAGAASEVEVQTYSATCPENSSPSWGLLVWDSDLSGAATITFEARASTTGTFSGATTLLGTAQLGSPNTSQCSLGSALSECPVDITKALFPPGMLAQPEHLELTITLHPSGTDVPTLHDWGITYSCQVDQ